MTDRAAAGGRLPCIAPVLAASCGAAMLVLGAEDAAVVGDTLQPAHVSLWPRSPR